MFPDIARHFKHYTYLDSIPVPVITGTLLVIFLIFIIIPSHFSGTSRRTRPTGLSGQLSPMRQLPGNCFSGGKVHGTLYGSQKGDFGCILQLWPKVMNRFGQKFYPMQVVKIGSEYMYFGSSRSTRSKTVGVQSLTFLDLIFQNSFFNFLLFFLI